MPAKNASQQNVLHKVPTPLFKGHTASWNTPKLPGIPLIPSGLFTRTTFQGMLYLCCKQIWIFN